MGDTVRGHTNSSQLRAPDLLKVYEISGPRCTVTP